MRNFLIFVESLASGILPFTVLMLTGVYLTAKTNGYQLKNLGKAFKEIFKSDKDNKHGVSTFGAVCTSLSAAVGTGNIAGVSAALSLGGAGAVFWMWISALVGMCVKSAEIVLGIIYRQNTTGGPMYYIKKGLPKRYTGLAFLFAFIGIFSVISTGNLTQVNAAVYSISSRIDIRFIFGIVFAIIVLFVVVGGVKKISNFTSIVVPLMSVLYIILCFGIIFNNINALPKAFSDIFTGAFNPKAVTGGAVGSIFLTAINGAKKGVFSNEAGLGTAAMAHASADKANPQSQGLFGIFEVFTDTILICTLTALTILTSGVIIDYGNVASSELVNSALSTLYGDFSYVLLSLMLCLFGISSVIGWAVYGICCTEFLFGKTGKKAFIIIYPLFCVIGAVCNIETAWRISEFFNGIMLLINVFAILLLSDKAFPFLKGVKNVQHKNRKITKQSAK